MGSNKAGPRISQSLQALLQHCRSPEPTGSNNSSSSKFRPTKRASVLICLFEGDDGNLRVFLTLRASSLSTHSGEVALPGGKREEGDANDEETALREAKEEIGLDPSLVTVIASLDLFCTKWDSFPSLILLNPAHCSSPFKMGHKPIRFTTLKYGVAITPVIGILSNKDAFTPILNPDEVEALFDVPLEMFLKDENRRDVEKEWMGKKHLVHFFDYEVDNKKHVIWAITAAMLIRAASLVYQRPPAFLELRPSIWGGLTENDILILQSNSKV